MRGLHTFFFGALGRPLIALPVGAFRRRFISHAFPPNAAIRRESHVGEDGVLPQRGHGVGIGLVARSRCHTKESGLRIDRVEPSIRTGFDPRDVVAHGPDLPALVGEVLRRNEHGEVRFAAGARESRCDIGFLPFRIFDTEDEHVLGQPALVTSHRRRDAQREAFLTQQRVAAVARTVAPDLTQLGEVNDVLLLVAGPGHVLLAFFQRRTDGVHARHHTLFRLVDLLEHFFSYARHDAHVHHDVGRVGELHADL